LALCLPPAHVLRVHTMAVVNAQSSMKFVCLLTLLQAVAVASVQDPPKPPTPLERLGRETQVQATRASASASDARSAADEMEARLAAEASARSRRAAEAAASEIAQRTLTIKGAAIEAQKAQAGTGMWTTEGAKVLASAVAGMAKAKKDAAVHVAKEVDDELQEVYMGLQDWKMKVIHDPMKEATKAGMKAALPYEKALQTIEKRVSDYETRATGLSNQARSLRTMAVGLADGAVKKQAGGALKAAETDMMQAHTMMNQATMFEAQGLKLIKQAQIWNVQIPTYVGAASGAAHQKTWQYAKKLYAPPPISMGLPPPTKVFLQKESSLHDVHA